MTGTPGNAPPRGDAGRARESAYRMGYRSGFDGSAETRKLGDGRDPSPL